VDPGEHEKEDYVFKGPEVRRMSAEEFRDALASLTGVGYLSPDADLGMGENAKGKFGPKKKAKWIWNDPNAANKAKAESIYLRKTVRLPAVPAEATALVVCDNSFEFFVNGHKAGAGSDFNKPFLIDLKPWLKIGNNLIAIHAI